MTPIIRGWYKLFQPDTYPKISCSNEKVKIEAPYQLQTGNDETGMKFLKYQILIICPLRETTNESNYLSLT